MGAVVAARRAGSARSDDRTERYRRLLYRVSDGDKTAFAALYDDIAPTVYGSAVRVLQDPDHAAEVAQEVMVEVWRSAASFDGERGSVQAWVSTIAHRRAIDRVRAVQMQRDRDQRVLDRSHEPPRDEVVEAVESRWEQRQVRGCLGTLTDVQGDAIRRTYYEGSTYREAAEQASVALPTMKSRIRDALLALRRCLEGE